MYLDNYSVMGGAVKMRLDGSVEYNVMDNLGSVRATFLVKTNVSFTANCGNIFGDISGCQREFILMDSLAESKYFNFDAFGGQDHCNGNEIKGLI